MFQKFLANKHLWSCDSRISLVRPSGGLGLWTRQQKKNNKNKPKVDYEPRSAHGRAIKKRENLVSGLKNSTNSINSISKIIEWVYF